MPYPSLTFTQLLNNATKMELEQLIALFQGYLSAQHKDDGSHGDVTADSLDVETDITAGGDLEVEGSVTADADGTPIVLSPDTTFGPGVGLTSGANSSWRIEGSPSAATLTIRDLLRTASHADTGTIAIVRTASGATGDYTLKPHASYILLSLGADSSGQRIAEVNATLVRAFSGYYERARTAAVGEFTSFTGTVALTASTGLWDGATVARAHYRIVGKEARVEFNIHSSDVSATPADLIMSLPAGITPTAANFRTIQVSNAGAAAAVGIARVAAGTAEIRFQSTAAGGAWGTTAANDTFVRGDIAFEV
jgi:hypothetical protein